ncbi:MAG: AMP-binding protein [Acidobacteria bacterium]|nr:AMP-binding protein [Acidobacteriota bacterium]
MTTVPYVSESWASLWEALADAQPDQIAVVLGDQEIRWSELDDHAARLSSVFAEHGVKQGSRVAQLLYNDAAYLESVYALFKLRATPVNVNYRYLVNEVAYILNNSEAEVLLYHASLADRVEGLKELVPSLRSLIRVDDLDGREPLPSGHIDYATAISSAPLASRIERSGEDLLFLYTGGTTGMPKGVMWRHVDLFGALASSGYQALGLPLPTTSDEVGRVARQLNAEGKSPTNLCAPPLMHGVALFLAMSSFVLGGKVVLLKSRKFDPAELVALTEKYRVNQISLVGDAFAKPINRHLEALEASGAKLPDLTSVARITSSGATLSGDQKLILRRFMPNATMIDMLGASEGGPFGIDMTTPDKDPLATAVFVAPPNVVTFDDQTWEIIPRGSGKVGVLGASGAIPQGYFKDPEKSASTFRTVDGVRYTVPGDYALIDADGTMHLLGRGSVCINTGGEKVYPEEVEVVARAVAGIADCTVVGVPDDRFGNAVVAIVSRSVGSSITDAELVAEMRKSLAAYKCPKHVVFVDAVYRSPSGKADYKISRETAMAALGLA